MFGIFKIPTAQQIVRKKLIETERELLAALEREEHARAITTMYRERLARLRDTLVNAYVIPGDAEKVAKEVDAQYQQFMAAKSKAKTGPATIPLTSI